MKHLDIYDTTLRDGTQAEDINFTVEDKVRITHRLDEFGIDYIEGGWPGSNPRDMAYFEQMKGRQLKHAKVTAFGSTQSPKKTPETDPNLKALVEAGTPALAVVGKSWHVHVRDALRISNERNIEIIRDSLAWLRPRTEKLFFDAEHFFDGFKADRDFALGVLRAAADAGADALVLCDTNGGSLTSEIKSIIRQVRKALPKTALGIHVHNDAELAVANTLAAVEAGVRQVQGTINGFGERCGNANLCSIIPALVLKMKRTCKAGEKLEELYSVSRLVNELANKQPNIFQPYVGRSAFAHKGGIHVSAVERNPETYEHINPERVGNVQRILVSDLSGKSTIINKARKFGLKVDSRDPAVADILRELKELENRGFQYDGAEGSFELLMNRALGGDNRYFELLGFRVIDQKVEEGEIPVAEATIMVKVDGQVEHTASVGDGPVNALDNAIRKALEKFYPQLSEMRLEDFKVRVLPGIRGTGAVVRVLIQSGDGRDSWGTVGVSHDVIEASWQALVDSISYKLYKDEKKP